MRERNFLEIEAEIPMVKDDKSSPRKRHISSTSTQAVDWRKAASVSVEEKYFWWVSRRKLEAVSTRRPALTWVIEISISSTRIRKIRSSITLEDVEISMWEEGKLRVLCSTQGIFKGEKGFLLLKQGFPTHLHFQSGYQRQSFRLQQGLQRRCLS